MEQGEIPKSPVGCQRGVKSQEGAERPRMLAFREKSIRTRLHIYEILRQTAAFRLTHVPALLPARLSHGPKSS